MPPIPSLEFTSSAEIREWQRARRSEWDDDRAIKTGVVYDSGRCFFWKDSFRFSAYAISMSSVPLPSCSRDIGPGKLNRKHRRFFIVLAKSFYRPILSRIFFNKLSISLYIIIVLNFGFKQSEKYVFWFFFILVFYVCIQKLS